MSDEINSESEDMLPQYDFSNAVRGKFVRQMRQGYSVTFRHEDGSVTRKEYAPEEGVIILDPDLRLFFPDSESVNRTLRSLIALIPQPHTE